MEIIITPVVTSTRMGTSISVSPNATAADASLPLLPVACTATFFVFLLGILSVCRAEQRRNQLRAQHDAHEVIRAMHHTEDEHARCDTPNWTHESGHTSDGQVSLTSPKLAMACDDDEEPPSYNEIIATRP